ncbi:hypothetical protein [Escherichia phage slur08]|nr:hypothetical protein CHD94UKE2_058 [Escherichia phage vB_EcoM-CHD94UKE2]QZI81734.1 hypothetical protein G3F7_057 [Escherichia phage vB_EcoM-G3F7]QZI82604.1 hypothetical protein G3F10_057 [Escherichia phage vB_EcoM-G3F10]CUL02747.1 hypothetical protein [Escherichia phage slur08]
MKSKIIAVLLLILMVIISIYYSVTVPLMIPTIILGWSLLLLQIKYECIN